MDITLNLSPEQAKAILTGLRNSETLFLSELEAIRANIRAIEDQLAPSPWLTTTVTSSDGQRTYRISKHRRTGDMYCSCPSFQYRTGIDPDGRCKHIRQALADGAFPGR